LVCEIAEGEREKERKREREKERKRKREKEKKRKCANAKRATRDFLPFSLSLYLSFSLYTMGS